MADSFYGGKPGFSFIIVKNFASVNEMATEFKKGPNFSAVHYDEHVLINTENKNDPDNGKIYRRGYDYSNDLGGAIYVGTIVGPGGPAPKLEMTTVADIKSKKGAVNSRYTEGSYAPTTDLVPGKKPDGTFNDVIQWACCSIRDADNKDCTAYIGFIFPYLVQEFEASSVDPYYNRDPETGANFTNTGLITRLDPGDHPFYEKWKISVPKGIKGDTLKNFRVMQATDNIDYTGHEAYKADDVAQHREVLVYDYYVYDASGTPTPTTIYLGDYNMITAITIDEDGTVNIDYTHDNKAVFFKKFRWIKNVTLTENGLFTVNYNNDIDGSSVYQTYLQWVKDVSLEANGDVILHYSHDNDKIINHIKWVTKTAMSADGTITVTYNDGTVDTLANKVRWITNVAIQTDNGDGEGSGDQKVHLNYNDGVSEAIGEPLNYIIDMVTTDDYHLAVYYSDPDKRKSIPLSQRIEYNNKPDWLDLGSLKDEDGILIGLNIDTDEYPQLKNDIQASIDFLNKNYPSGLTEEGIKGKVVTVGSNAGDDDKRFYAFDYGRKPDSSYKGWYYLGAFQNNASSYHMIAGTSDSDLSSKQEALVGNGLWFVLNGKHYERSIS